MTQAPPGHRDRALANRTGGVPELWEPDRSVSSLAARQEECQYSGSQTGGSVLWEPNRSVSTLEARQECQFSGSQTEVPTL